MNTIELLLSARDGISAKLRSWVPQWTAQASLGARGISAEVAEGIEEGIYKYDKNGRLRNASRQFVGIGGQVADSIQREVGEVSLGKLIGASAVGNLVAQGITGAIGLGMQQLANFQRGVLDAAQIQTSMISDASDLSRTLGVTMSQAQELVAKTRLDIANIAAALPGETRDYSAVFQSLSATIGEFNRGNPAAFQEEATDMTKRVGFLSTKVRADPFMSGSAINRFIQGTAGFGELRGTIDLFQKNPMFLKAIEQSAAALGLDLEKGFKNASSELRYRVLQQALETTVTDDLIKEFDNTAEGYLQTLKTKLLDPDIGLFGFLRKVPVPGSEGRSVIDAVTVFLGNFSQLSDTIAKAFPGFDPLAPIVQTIDILTGLIGDANQFITQFNSGLSFDIPSVAIDWSSVFLGVSEFFIGVVDQLNAALPLLTDVIYRVDWGALGSGLVDIAWLALGALGATLISIEWSGVKDLLVAGVTAASHMLTGAISQGITKIAEGLTTDLGELLGVSEEFTRTLRDTLRSFFDAVLRAIPVVGQVYGMARSITGTQGMAQNPEASGASLRRSATTGILDAASSILPGIGLARDLFGAPGNSGAQSTSEAVPLAVPRQTLGQNYTFAPSINVQGTSLEDPHRTADLIMQQLGDRWDTFQAGRLTR